MRKDLPIIDLFLIVAYFVGEGAGKKHGVKLGDLTVSEQIVPCEDCRSVMLPASSVSRGWH